MPRKGDEKMSFVRFVADIYYRADGHPEPDVVAQHEWVSLATTLRAEGLAKRESYG